MFQEVGRGQSLFGRNHDVWYKVLSFLTMYNIDNPEESRVWDASQNEHLNEISRRIDALNPKFFHHFEPDGDHYPRGEKK